MPLYMRLPKKGFSNAPFRKIYAIVNLEQLESAYNSEEVNRETLIEKGILKGQNKRLPIKVLSKGAITKKLNFSGIEKFSKTALAAIEKAGGQISQTTKKND